MFESLVSDSNWSGLMYGLRLVLTFGGALLLIYEARSYALNRNLGERLRKRVAIVMSVAAFGSYFSFFNPNVRYSGYFHRHEFFHHYLGAKYAREIGYNRLYQCVAIAEIELGRRAEVIARDALRDLATNTVSHLSDTYVLRDPEQCKRNFSPTQWQFFRQDVDWFYSVTRGSYWEGMQKDHGCNAPPVWKLGGKFFANFGRPNYRFFQVLASLDILLLLSSIVMIFWAFGWRVGAIASVFWGCNAPSDFHWMGGAFLRQDWLFLLIASLCLARKRMFFLAGFALTWSSLVRIFPAIFFVGWVAIICRSVAGRLKDPVVKSSQFLERVHPDHRRLLAGVAAALAILVPASMVVLGPSSHLEFFQHITVLDRTPLTSNMGLATMLTHGWDERMCFLRDESLTDAFSVWKDARHQRYHVLLWFQLGIATIVLGWTIWVLRRTRLLWLGPPLALPFMMSLMNFGCYYYSMFTIAALLAMSRPALGPILLVASGASQILLASYYWVDDRYAAQSWLFWILSLILLVSYSRPCKVRVKPR